MSTLYVIATPIGNLADLSERAVRTLSAVDAIACEDTRTSGRLLKHLEIDKPLLPFHQHNEHRQVTRLMERLQAGESIALISDAGMPGISDPGFLAVRATHHAGFDIRVIPGPDACTTALVASGLPCDRYLFDGFLPPKKGRQTRLAELAEREITSVLFESPHRLVRLLGELEEHAGPDRLVCIARELTKLHEEIDRGSVSRLHREWKERPKIKGEVVVVVAGADYSEPGKEGRHDE